MKKLIVLIVSLCFVQWAFASSESEVKDAYSSWCQAVGQAKGDAAVMVKFYAPDAILLPTLSAKILHNTDGGLNDYFKMFTGNQDIKCLPQQLITNIYGDMAINSGTYDFTYLSNNQPTLVHARFTFVYKKENNQWLIVNQHSSKLP